MLNLSTPLKDVTKLKVGDSVLLSGTVFTARDEAHRYLTKNIDEKLKRLFKNGVIYHCGPIVKETKNGYIIVSAGPTTSIREEKYESKIIEEYGVRAIIGKGGLGKKSLEAFKKFGAVYLQTIGGAGAALAKTVVNVRNVYKLEFGVPEAIWELEVKDFPAIVTMDSHGKSLYEDIKNSSEKVRNRLILQ